MGESPAPVVVKLGTSSLTGADGRVKADAIESVATQVAGLRATGRPVVVVSSGAVTAGLPVLGIERRPADVRVLQAVSAVGQIDLVRTWQGALAAHGLVAGQVLLTPYAFRERVTYLQARSTLSLLLEMGAVPLVNENDAVADDELRFGDNDRIAALVAHLVNADLLVLLTDTPGLLSADPRLEPEASLIEEIVEIDQQIEHLAGRPSERGSGGMAAKVAAAKIAAWTGVRTVIADAERPDVVIDAVAGAAGVGTVVLPRTARLSARKLWIAFATGSAGRVTVDAGARAALVDRQRSLLPAGVRSVEGRFEAGSAVEVADESGDVFAKGLVRLDAGDLRAVAGRRTPDLPDGTPHETIHRDDLVVLPT